MLTDDQTAPRRLDATAPSRPDGQRSDRALRIERVLAFGAAAGLLLAYALRGGSYDILAFEENGLLIWWILALGFALGLLPRSRPSPGSLLLLAAFAAYAAWTALSLIWTSSSELTFAELARSLDYLGLVTLLIGVADRRNWRAAVAGLGFGALLVCVVAVGTRLAPGVFGHDAVSAALHIDRLSAPFGYWNAVAAWGAMCVALGVVWSAHDTVLIRRAVALGLVPIAAATVYLTYSRAGAAGSALALIAALGLSRNRITTAAHAVVAALATAVAIAAIRHYPQIADGTGTRGAGTVAGVLVLGAAACAAAALLTARVGVDRRRVPRPVVRTATAAAVVVLVVGGVGAGPRLLNRAWSSFKAPPAAQTAANPTARLSNLSGSRYEVWWAAIRSFDAHPMDGSGAGTFQFWWNQHGSDDEFLRDSHNIWLQNMAELGVPGLLLIVAVAMTSLGTGVAVLRRTRRSHSAGAAAAVLAALLVYLFHASVDWMWQSTAVTVLAFGGIAALSTRLSSARARFPVPARIGLACIAVGAGVLQLPGQLSTTAIRRSQVAQRVGSTRVALTAARDAIDAEPWSASAYEQRGLVYESTGQLRQAAQDLQSAVTREPLNYEHWLILSRIETEAGRLAIAVHDYERARQLRPRASVFAFAPYFRTR